MTEKITGQRCPPSTVEDLQLPEGWCVTALASPRTKNGAVKVYLSALGWTVQPPDGPPHGPMPLEDAIAVADFMVTMNAEGRGWPPAKAAAEAHFKCKEEGLL